jgi:hypothetical protein
MSFSDALRNDPYAWIDDAARDIDRASAELLATGDAARVSDAAVASLMTAAIRLYAAKSDGEERTFRPLTGARDETVTATQALTAVSEILRALNLGPTELALWYRRRPDEPPQDGG